MATLNVMPDNSKVNHPSHYSGSIEAIDAIAAATAELEGVEAFDTGNALKYLWRWKHKNGVEDLNKAIWYIQHLITHLEGMTKTQAVETQPSLRDYMTEVINTDKAIPVMQTNGSFCANATDQLMRNLGADISTIQAQHDCRLS